MSEIPEGKTEGQAGETGNIAELRNKLAESLAEVELRNRELSALMRGARVVLTRKDFAGAARSIFDYCKDLIGATSGYVALLNSDGSENEVLFLESGNLPCDVDPNLPMPIRGYWKQIEIYIQEHSDADFTHSICPNCIKVLYPEMEEFIRLKMENGKDS